jgi:hypothetical protein
MIANSIEDLNKYIDMCLKIRAEYPFTLLKTIVEGQTVNPNDVIYNETFLATRELKIDLCFQPLLAAPAVDGSKDIFVWTNATFIEKVAYYPFTYKYIMHLYYV